jgi:beta-1,2-mannobiose phosphorylase / 1,2-beta-oligomannan phosphorylase
MSAVPLVATKRFSAAFGRNGPEGDISLASNGNIVRVAFLPTGVADAGDHYIVASGEADLACRITHIPKALFA